MKRIVTIGLAILFANSETSSQLADTAAVIRQIDSLSEVAYGYMQESRYESAHAVFRDALKFGISSLGENHIHIGHLRHKLGLLYSNTRYSSDTKYQFVEALRIKRQNLPPDHPSNGLTLMSLGNVYEEEGNLYLAETYYLQARDIWQKYIGIHDEQFGHVQHHLGKIYEQQSRDKEALACLSDALRIKESVLGADNPELGHLLNLLSSIYLRQGSYAAYEVCALRAAEIWNKQRGIDDLLYYHAKHNLSVFNELIGNHSLALDLAREAASGKKRVLGPDDQDVAISLIALATVHAALGHTDSTEYLLETAKEILEREVDLYRFEYAWVLNNLGLMAMSGRDFVKARKYLAISIAIKEKLTGTQNLDYSSVLISYAKTLFHTGATDSAIVLLRQQREFYEYNKINTHIDYLRCLEALFDVAYSESRFEEAISVIRLANQINKQIVSDLSEYASEQELYAYLDRTRPLFHKYLSLGFSSGLIQPELRRELYEMVLFYKGFVLDKYFEIRNHVAWDPESLGVFRSLTAQKRVLAEQHAKLLTNRTGITSIEKEIARLEAELAIVIQLHEKHNYSWDEILMGMQKQEVRIEFVEYKDEVNTAAWTTRYGAILVSTAFDAPVFIQLPETSRLSHKIFGSVSSDREYVTQMYEEKSMELYEIIWKPITPFIKDVDVVYVSPTGMLHLINFSAIPADNQTVLADHHDLIRCLNTGQTTLRHSHAGGPSDCAVFGGIDYDLDTIQFSEHRQSAYTTYTSYIEPIDFTLTDTTMRGNDWTYLKGSDYEIQEISMILQHAQFDPTLHRGSDATEEQFKSLSRSRTRSSSPKIIHLSTHGYFFPNRDHQWGRMTLQDVAPVFKHSDHPMMRSGLILARANYAWKTGHAYRPDMEDGILTAYEISLMDLSNTELVVLSACETGLGDIEGNDGVYGLQRAFKVAGVRNLIMSLWRVPDAATAHLMTLFYENWLEQGMTVRQALQMAQKEMRNEGWEHFYWAGFVLVE